jgi:hypothetical protein
MRGFHDLCRQQSSCLFILLGWSSDSSLKIYSVSGFGGEDIDVLELDVMS